MTIGGTRVAAGLAVSTVGAGGPALVFVHGFACAATDWRAQVTSFATENTVVTVDLAGHGKNRAAAAKCTIVDYGRCVAQALSELALAPAVLIGHSMGCRVVLEAARRRPEAVAGLVLIDGSRIGEGDPVAARRAKADEIVGDGYQRFIRKFFGSMFVTSSDDELKRAITERALHFSGHRQDTAGRLGRLGCRRGSKRPCGGQGSAAGDPEHHDGQRPRTVVIAARAELAVARPEPG